MKKDHGLSTEALYRLFDAAIENAFALWTVSTNNLESDKTIHLSLGLGELALEELGKSYTCLAYYCLGGKGGVWSQFWKDWKNHNVKAHRAYFYEFFCLWRIETEQSLHHGPTIRDRIAAEKEVSFYVDYDLDNNQVRMPFKDIGNVEIMTRVSSVVGPLNAALKVRDLLKRNESTEYRLAVSHYALRTITEPMFQQDVENVLSSMKKGVPAYDQALLDIQRLFAPNDPAL